MVMPNIDDLSPLNDNGICEKYKSHIYPDDLDLNRENYRFWKVFGSHIHAGGGAWPNQGLGNCCQAIVNK